MVYRIGALSWDKDFKDFFENSVDNHEIKIHSIFNSVINISSADGTLYAVVDKHKDPASYTLRLDFEENFKDILNKEDKIRIEKNSIMIGNLEISLSDLSIHKNKRERVSDFSVSNIKNNIEIFNKLITGSGGNGGCKAFYFHHLSCEYDNNESLIEKEVAKRIQHFYNNLMDDTLDENSIRNLVGLGIGLTPSGDDFLTGFLASAGIFDCNRDLVDKIRIFIYPLLSSTSDISATMLKSALEDKFREFLNIFVNSFFGCDKEELIKAFENLLTIGSSSGVDMSIGVLMGFLYTIEKVEIKGGSSNDN